MRARSSVAQCRALEEKGRGILLLHDIHPATALAVPVLLKELKERGYRVVQVVAAGERPASVPELLGAPEYNKEGWPVACEGQCQP